MKSLFFPKSLLISGVILLAIACKQPETVVVGEDPTAAVEDTTQKKAAERNNDFQKLVMGEYNAIGSLDPLFANNASEMRTIQLVYEGLVRFNGKGDIVSALAKSWTVSKDSLLYEFNLRPDIFYHDSDVFSTGTGRRLTSKDVKFVFERMAKVGVPPRAAHLFMNIEGFDSYFQEQRFVYNPEYRQIKSISGIQTPNDTTITFELVNRDPDFIKKLATPLAAIYPQEAVGDSDTSFSAVGTGPFTFSEQTADSTYIFSKFDNYYAADKIELNRIDMPVAQSEMLLFKSMSRGEIQLLPQLGPQLIKEILNEEGELLPSYKEQYRLRKPGGATQYALRYNPNSSLSESAARKIAGFIQTDTNSYFERMPDNLVQTNSFVDTTTMAANQQKIYSTFSADPFIQTFLGRLSKNLASQGISLQMMNIRTPVKNTALLFTHDFPLIPNAQWSDYEKLFSFKVKHVTLQRPAVEGLSFNRYPWWIEMRGVSIPETDNLN